MEITNVKTAATTVFAGEKISITFEIVGAYDGFEFPFSNESLSDPKIIFISKEDVT